MLNKIQIAIILIALAGFTFTTSMLIDLQKPVNPVELAILPKAFAVFLVATFTIILDFIILCIDAIRYKVKIKNHPEIIEKHRMLKSFIIWFTILVVWVFVWVMIIIYSRAHQFVPGAGQTSMIIINQSNLL